MARSGGGTSRPSHPPPRKRLGQHFLTDPNILGRIADAARLDASDTVIEIGPGRGALTEQLRARAGRVIAIELDRTLARSLRERYAGESETIIIEADVLAVDLGELAGGEYVLVGNVPYYITTPIVFHALRRRRAKRAVFLVQREVADRIVAAPGAEEYGALSANVQALALVESVFRVPAGAFQPAPSVDSAVIRLTPRADPLVEATEEESYRAFVQEAFGMRRKQMRRVLRELWEVDASVADALLESAGVRPDARPETLSPDRFAALLRARGARDELTRGS